MSRCNNLRKRGAEMNIEEIKNFVLTEADKGNIVYQDIEGLHSLSLEDFIKQPLQGMLYDLNRSPEVILTFIKEPKWVNDYAMMLLLTYFYDKTKPKEQK